jgi:hypothetical protein
VSDGWGVSINREDLIRLCEVLNSALPPEVHIASPLAGGWALCVQAIMEIAEKMPTDCVLIPRAEFERLVAEEES